MSWHKLDLGRAFAELRELAGASHGDVGKAVKVARSWSSKAEASEGRIKLSTLLRLARALGFEVEVRVRRTR